MALARFPRWLAVIWLCFLLRGFFYCAELPLWEGWDEYSHYAYVEHLLRHGGSLPVPGQARNSEEVERSLAAGPVAWSVHQMLPETLPYERFWQLAPAERGMVRPRPPQLLYEAQQPPLYYWLMAAPLKLTLHWPLASRVFCLRVCSLLLASLVIPVGFLAARRLLGSEPVALGLIAAVAALPELMINICRIGNEGPALVLYALLLLIAAKLLDRPGNRWLWLAAGGVIGCGLLTKAYFLATAAALPVFAVCLLLRARTEWKRIAAGSAMASVVALATAGWWYAFIRQATGTLTGQIQTVDIRHLGVMGQLAGLLHMNWRQAIDTITLSWIWFGGWSFLQMRSWIYHLCYAVLVAAVIGIILLARKRTNQGLLLTSGFVTAPIVAAVFYHALVTHLTIGQSTSNGWYLQAAIVAEAVLLYAGLATLLGERMRPWILPVGALGAAALDIYGMLFLLAPYHHGLTRHLANGHMESFHLGSIAGYTTERLLHNRPYLGSVETLLALAILWLVATLALPVIAHRLTVR